MKKFPLLPPGIALATAVLFLAPFVSRAQASEAPPAKSSSPEELSQADLLKSYLQLRDQLQTSQLAIANNRVEAEAAARAQASMTADRLEAITAAMEAERERHRMEMDRHTADRERDRAEAQRLEAERDRRQADLENSNRTVIWVVSGVGGIGLLAILLSPLLYWRTINRVTELAALRPQLLAPPEGLKADGTPTLSDRSVTFSNQQLLSAIDRIDRRVREFEQMWDGPRSTSPPNGGRELELVRPPNAVSDQTSRIRVLLAKGQSLLDLGKTVEALSSYNDVLRLDPNHPEALVKRGAALERLKQDDEAIQCYDRAIKSNRKMTLAYLHKGAVCNRLERYEEAVKCYEQALSVEAEG
jgi:tetratricopeptide (TPR) repeat protein